MVFPLHILIGIFVVLHPCITEKVNFSSTTPIFDSPSNVEHSSQLITSTESIQHVTSEETEITTPALIPVTQTPTLETHISKLKRSEPYKKLEHKLNSTSKINGSQRIDNGRSIDVDVEKYTSKQFHNNEFELPESIESKKFINKSEYEFTSTSSEESKEIGTTTFNYLSPLTTPKSEFFDKSYKETIKSVQQALEQDYEEPEDVVDFKNENNTEVNDLEFKNIVKNKTLSGNSLHEELLVNNSKRYEVKSFSNKTYGDETSNKNNSISKDVDTSNEHLNIASNELLKDLNDKSTSSKNEILDSPTTRRNPVVTKITSTTDDAIINNKIETEVLKTTSDVNLTESTTQSKLKIKKNLNTTQARIKTESKEQTAEENQLVSQHVQAPIKSEENITEKPEETTTLLASTEETVTKKVHFTDTKKLLQKKDDGNKIIVKKESGYGPTPKMLDITKTTEWVPTDDFKTTIKHETTTDAFMSEYTKADNDDEAPKLFETSTDLIESTTLSMTSTIKPEEVMATTLQNEINKTKLDLQTEEVTTINTTTEQDVIISTTSVHDETTKDIIPTTEKITSSTEKLEQTTTTRNEDVSESVTQKMNSVETVSERLNETTTTLKTNDILRIPTITTETLTTESTDSGITNAVDNISTTTITNIEVIHLGDDNNSTFQDVLKVEEKYPVPDVIVTKVETNMTTEEGTTITTTDFSQTSEEFSTVGNPDNNGTIIAIIVSSVGGVCLIVLALLLIIMKKRQKRSTYAQRCRPVSLDDYSVDNASAFVSVRRKAPVRNSKRSYGNPAFEDSSSVSHPLNFPNICKFASNLEDVKAEFDEIPQITVRTTELPEGCDTKNRYANVIPLPETRVFLTAIDGCPNSDYINANYVTGPKSTRGYYIACQAPMTNTVDDFWRMIWEQQCKVILMLTHFFEKGIEKCVDYLPPSEVLDCHRMFGDYQITLKKREVKEKYVISSLQLKNMVSNSWRNVTHFWYIGWPEKGVPLEANSLIAFLIEARSFMKTATIDKKQDLSSNINGIHSSETNPVVVHCSPGTGRTGVMIACDIAIREFEQTRLVDIPKIVYKIRRDRASAVQTKDQYAFIYKVLCLYASKITGGSLDSI